MHIRIALIDWEQREAVLGIRINMKFVELASNLVLKDCKLLINTSSPS